jgi:hypothetical protein
MLPPLAVLLIGGCLAILALKQPISALALAPAATPSAQAILPTESLIPTSSPQTVPQAAVPTTAPAVYDGSGQLALPSSAPPEVAQVYDGSGQLALPTAVPPEISQVYDGSGQPITGAPVQPAAPTPEPGLIPQIQAVIVTALANDNPAPAAPVTGLAPFFRPEVLYWGDSILRWSASAGVDPNLAAVVMQIESCGDPRARSHAGAMGLFQVMPFHFAGGDNPYDPDTNALRGLAYLARSMRTANGDARLALAGYNGGIGVINRGEWTWSSETLRYIRFGGPMYEDARRGAAQSAALDEWYSKYGVSLCRQASERQ